MKRALAILLSLLPLFAAAQDEGEPTDPLASLQSAYARAVRPGPLADQHRELFATVLQRVQRTYALEVDLAALSAAAIAAIETLPPEAGEPGPVFGKAINAALRTLDPYSRYLDPSTHGNERGESSGSFGGLGLEVESSDGMLRVVAPMPGTPAARAGVQAGDLIVRLDDAPLAGVPLADAIARMRGQPGTQVALTIRRKGVAQEITVAVVRDTIRRQLLRWTMEGDVLVLRLGSFSGAVTAALERAIAEATAAATPRAVILDLRGNPGGLLREAVLTADTFLGQGEIVSLRGRTPNAQRSWKADASELLAGLPMLVLIDRRSASASELVAAALQENGRARVMGQRSFGKGTVQSTWPLGEQKGALKLTTAFYHAPSGRAVQQAGVVPDVELLASGAAGAATDSPAALRVAQDRCPADGMGDAALACALAYLRAGGAQAFVEALAPAP